MDHPLEDALAAEIRAEIARQGLSRTEVAERAGIHARTWTRYFVTRDRDIPMDAVYSAAEALGVSAVELMRRAEAAVAADPGLPEDLALAADDGEREKPFDSQE